MEICHKRETKAVGIHILFWISKIHSANQIGGGGAYKKIFSKNLPHIRILNWIIADTEGLKSYFLNNNFKKCPKPVKMLQ